MADKAEGSDTRNENDEVNNETEEETCTFKSLGVVDVLCEACEGLKWKNPTKIQRESIPVALAGNDVIGLAETGSGKTGAFALPILQQLLENPQRLFALVLTPTRELAFQISEQFEALGSTIGKYLLIIHSQDQDQDSLLVKRRNDNHSPGPVIRELVPSSHQRSELSNTILCIFSG